jgi:uncharacterized protein YaiL (DUF2058 family)
MGSLQEELMKARLVDKKQRKKAAHDTRIHRSKVGREGLEQEQQEKDRRRQAQAEEKRAKDRQLDIERQKARETVSSKNRLQSLISGSLLKGGTGGPRRFCYVNRTNRVPFLEVNDDVARRLTRGELAIIETEDGQVGLVPGTAAGEIAELDSEAVRFWNRSNPV